MTFPVAGSLTISSHRIRYALNRRTSPPGRSRIQSAGGVSLEAGLFVKNSRGSGGGGGRGGASPIDIMRPVGSFQPLDISRRVIGDRHFQGPQYGQDARSARV